MKKSTKILLFIGVIVLALFIKNGKVNASEYIWPIGGNNANETYKDYDYYGYGYGAPYKNGKSGREYIVDNTKWPNEKYYYAYSESHYGMDITGINGHTYTVVSVVNGNVIATSANAIAANRSTWFQDRNQRRTWQGLSDGGGYGNYVIIQETSTGRCFLYAHLRAGSIKVIKGSKVTVGQEIATMGSSGDAGHMHLHFEIRTSKANTIWENYYGYHYLVSTTSYTNLDPENYIGTRPNVHTPYTDIKRVNISKEDMGYYIKYLYETVLKRKAAENEVEYWKSVYEKYGSIAQVTRCIFLSVEANNKLGNLSNLDFSKKAYEVVLYRGNKYTEQEMSGHVDKLNRGIWDRFDYLNMLCNCNEFANYKISAIIKDEKKKDRLPGLAEEGKINKIGDLNADGKVNVLDASVCLGLYAELSSSKDCNKYNYAMKYADINGDGSVDARDATLILSYSCDLAAGNIDMATTPIEQYARR